MATSSESGARASTEVTKDSAAEIVRQLEDEFEVHSTASSEHGFTSVQKLWQQIKQYPGAEKERLLGGETLQIENAVQSLNNILGRYHLLPIVALLRATLKSETTALKLSNLAAIFDLFLGEGGQNVAMRMKNILEYVTPALEMVKMAMSKPAELPQVVLSTTEPIRDQADLEDLDSASLDLETGEITGGNAAASWIEQNITYLRPLIGLVAMLAVSCGAHHVLKLDFISTMAKSTHTLAMAIKDRKTIGDEVETAVDSLLGVAFSAMGKTYFTPKQMRIRKFAETVTEVHKTVCAIHEAHQADVFGCVYEQSIASVNDAVLKLEKEFFKLTTEERNLYPFRHNIDVIARNLSNLRERRNQLIRGESKQEPVRVFFAGVKGVGKTVAAKLFIQSLRDSNMRPYSVYSRNAVDQYWSNYVGQGIVFYDDLGQLHKSTDIGEWHANSSANFTSVSAAAIEAKGMPFTSRFMVATSNYVDYNVKDIIADLDSFNRRRDLLVYVSNPARDAGVADAKGELPKSWWKAHPPTFTIIIPEGAGAVLEEYGAGHIPLNHPRRIAQVSLEELVMIAEEFELKRREEYRLTLLAREDVYGLVSIPNEPFKYNEDVLNMRKWYEADQACHRQRPGGPKPPRPGLGCTRMPLTSSEMIECAERAMALMNEASVSFRQLQGMSQDSVATDASSEPELPQVNFNPVGDMPVSTRRPIVVEGPPGCGKSVAIRAAFPDDKAYYVPLLISDYDAEITKIQQLTCPVIVDDFTVSVERAGFFRSLVVDYATGVMTAPTLVGSCNTGMDTNKGDARELIRRRSHAVDIAFRDPRPTHQILIARAKGESVRAHDVFRLYPQKADHVKWFKVTHAVNGDVYDSDITALSGLIADIAKHVVTKTVVLERVDEFIIPRPSDVKYTAIFPCTADSIKRYKIQDLLQIVKVLDDKGKKPPFSEKLAAAVKFAKVANHLQAYDFEGANRIFNMAEKKMNLGCTILIITTDQVFGFTDDGENSQTLMFTVEKTDETVRFVNGKFHQYGREVESTVKNAEYHKAVRRLFATKLEQSLGVMAPTDEDVAARLQAAHPLSRVAKNVTTLLVLFLRLASITTLLADCVNSLPKDPVEEEELPEEPERQKVATREPRRDFTVATTTKHTVGTGVTVQVEGVYDATSTKERRKLVIVPEITAQPYALLQRDDGVFGFEYNGNVVYFHESGMGNWTCAQQKGGPRWNVIDLDSLNGDYKTVKSARTYKTSFRLTTKDVQPAVRRLVGKSFTCANKGRDLGSILSCAFSTGIPFDVEEGLLCPSIVAEVFSQSGLVAPQSLVVYMESVFPHSAKLLNTDIPTEEGMLDLTSRSFCDQVAKNQVRFEIDGKHCVHGIMLTGRSGITVGHVPQSSTLIDPRSEKPCAWKVVVKSTRSDCVLFEITDKTVPMFPDIMNKIITRDDLAKYISDNRQGFPAVLTIFSRRDEKSVKQVHCSVHAALITKNHAGLEGRYSTHVTNLHVSGLTQPGDCGSALTIFDPRVESKFCGIHRAGSSTLSVCVYITREWVEDALKKGVLEPEDANPPTPEAAPQYVGMLNDVKHCPEIALLDAPYVRPDGLNVVGKVSKAPYVPGETKLYATGFTIDGVDICEPTVTDTKDPRSRGRNTLDEGVQRYGVQNHTVQIDRMEVREAMREIGNEYANAIASQGRDVRVLSTTEAVNRPPYGEYPNARPLDRSSSAGFPYIVRSNASKTKGDYLSFNEKQQKWYFATTPEAKRMQSHIDRVCRDAENGTEHIHPFVACSKDEPVLLRKIYEKLKTRVFFSGTFEYLVAYRRYFGGALNHIMSLHNVMPCKVGISTTFDEWNLLGFKLAEKSVDNCIATDLENYDSSIMTLFLQECMEVYRTIYTRCNVPEEDLLATNTARATLHRAVEGAHIIHKTDLLKFEQAMVSGCPGTAVENSFIIWALFYIIWKRLALKHDVPVANYAAFRKHVEIAIYGDDNISAVSPGYEWYNYNTIKAEAATMGFTLTDAKKLGGDQPDYIPLSEADFLQRRFEYHGGDFWGPLSLKSIGKPLMWVHDHKAYKVRAQHVPSLGGAWPVSQNTTLVAASIDALWPEIALQGKEYYENIRDQLMRQAPALGVVLNPPVWETLMLSLQYNVSSDY